MIPLVVSAARHGLGWPVLRLSPSSKRCVVRGPVEKGWWRCAVIDSREGVDPVVLVQWWIGKHGMRTNGDRVML